MRRLMLVGLMAVLPLTSAEAKVVRPPEDMAPVLAEADPELPAYVSKLTFADACSVGQRVTIAAVGDLLFHPELEREALTPKGSYRDFWQPVQSVLAGADISYGNFEGTSAEGITNKLEFVKDPGRDWNNRVYTAPSSELLFNYHPSVIDDLIASGFGIVSTANTHSLDRGPVGIDRTILNMSRRGLPFTGTRLQDATGQRFSTVTEVKGLRIGWLACTYATNGFPDRHSQVLYCFEQRGEVLAEIKRLASDPSIDAVILTPHWGLEGSPTPEQRQRDLARDAIEAGAAAVIGTHPHVLQPWEKVTTRDGREGLVVYSTGNFISAQHRPDQRLGAMVIMELTKGPGAAKARVSAAGYVSTWVETEGRHRVTEAPATMPSRFLPAGNRVLMADLPRLPRDCGAGEAVAESWGNRTFAAVASAASAPAQSTAAAPPPTAAVSSSRPGAQPNAGSLTVQLAPFRLPTAAVILNPGASALNGIGRDLPAVKSAAQVADLGVAPMRIPALAHLVAALPDLRIVTAASELPEQWERFSTRSLIAGSETAAVETDAKPLAAASSSTQLLRKHLAVIRALAATGQAFLASH